MDNKALDDLGRLHRVIERLVAAQGEVEMYMVSVGKTPAVHALLAHMIEAQRQAKQELEARMRVAYGQQMVMVDARRRG